MRDDFRLNCAPSAAVDEYKGGQTGDDAEAAAEAELGRFAMMDGWERVYDDECIRMRA